MKIITEFYTYNNLSMVSENLQYHILNDIPLSENVFRYGSEAWLKIYTEARSLYEKNVITFCDEDVFLLNTNLGLKGIYEGKEVWLDMPMPLNEAQYKGRDVELRKPKRGGSKKYYVYVINPKTKNVVKVEFGDTSGLNVKIKYPEARKRFATRHRCETKKDITKPGYWSCNLPRYAKMLGLAPNNINSYW